MFLFRA